MHSQRTPLAHGGNLGSPARSALSLRKLRWHSSVCLTSNRVVQCTVRGKAEGTADGMLTAGSRWSRFANGHGRRPPELPMVAGHSWAADGSSRSASLDCFGVEAEHWAPGGKGQEGSISHRHDDSSNDRELDESDVHARSADAPKQPNAMVSASCRVTATSSH